MRRLCHELIESVRIAAAQIRANTMRSALTVLGVVIGIVAVSLMGTAINGINTTVERSFAGFGDDVLYVAKWPWRAIDDWQTLRNRRPIAIADAREVNAHAAEQPDSALRLAVPTAERGVAITRGEYTVNRVHMLGTAADYARIARTDMLAGRFFSAVEAQRATNVAVIGFDVADALFPHESPLDRPIRINGQTFRVVGVLARQGAFLGLFTMDTTVAIPLTTYRRFFGVGDSGQLRVQVDPARLDAARDELRGVMRRLRGLGPEEKDDFEINEQRLIRERIDPVKNTIALAGLFITGLALFVGAIGIMNITFVSVKERTREIGTRKALGARRRTILLQFLIEAVAICLLGGVVGLLLTTGLAWILGRVFPAFPLIFSVGLVLLGLGVSVLTGIFSGFAPAWTASKLDPVEALRYE